MVDSYDSPLFNQTIQAWLPPTQATRNHLSSELETIKQKQTKLRERVREAQQNSISRGKSQKKTRDSQQVWGVGSFKVIFGPKKSWPKSFLKV